MVHLVPLFVMSSKSSTALSALAPFDRSRDPIENAMARRGLMTTVDLTLLAITIGSSCLLLCADLTVTRFAKYWEGFR